MHDAIPLTLSLILLAGMGAQWLAWWLRLPAILPLLAVGLVAGPIAGWLTPDQLFGNLLFPMVSLGVAVILFEGALTLRFAKLRGQARMVRNLVSFGVLLNGLLIALAARLCMNLPWSLALLFGALVTVTGPTVVAPLLRSVRPQQELANILHWESILIDPIGALLAVLVFEFTVSEQYQHTILMFGVTVITGALLGLAGAWLLATLMRRQWLPEYLHRVVSLALVLGVFTFANALAAESGLLAVTAMGIRLANTRDLVIEDILDFKETLTLLLISVLFIVLAARIDPHTFSGMGWGAVGVLLAILFIARPTAVWLAAIGSTLNWRQKAVLAWIAPRGIVAAAVSALFALQLERLGYSEARTLAALTFLVIVVTVTLQSLTARIVVQKLGMAAPPPRGVLIVGGNPVARAVAQALHEREIPVILADPLWRNVRAARMAGVPIYHGNVLSEHADTYLDLTGIGKLLALSLWPERNTLTGLYYRPLFGPDQIYTLRLDEERDDADRVRIVHSYRTARLFGEQVTLNRLQERLDQGHAIHATPLTTNFDFAAFRNKWGEQAILLFALDPKNLLRVFSTRETLQPGPGWILISLLPPVEVTKGAEAAA
ncbi:MAG: sodium:proton antiporter [Candidatus Contendobacter sp.]|jgi:NhaP-type Na+/H+ or K+/H+ antiporter|nr:sodium:proton antiporter [Gammaproteobacteria bacterium]MCC8995069.1 sodium:proton antiporter [Candidatus Contendobacter sp.]